MHRPDRENLEGAGVRAERLRAPRVELEPRFGDQVDEGPADQDLAPPAEGGQPRRHVDGDAAHLAGDVLALAGVEPGADAGRSARLPAATSAVAHRIARAGPSKAAWIRVEVRSRSRPRWRSTSVLAWMSNGVGVETPSGAGAIEAVTTVASTRSATTASWPRARKPSISSSSASWSPTNGR